MVCLIPQVLGSGPKDTWKRVIKQETAEHSWICTCGELQVGEGLVPVLLRVLWWH